MTDRLGELLVKKNYITTEQLQKALEEQKSAGGRLGSSLVKLGYAKENTLLSFLSEQYRIPSVNLSKLEINPNVIKLIPSSIVKKYFIIPINRVGTKLTLAMVDPSDLTVINEVEFITGFNVEPVIASENKIIDAIKIYYGGDGNIAGMGNISFHPRDYTLDDEKTSPEEKDLMADEDFINVDNFDALVHGAVDNVEVIETQMQLDAAGEIEGPIIKIVNGILIKAIKFGASDIHFEPYEKIFRVRYRIDGVMRREMALPNQIRNAVVSRLKIMARLDISERRLPQDGRIKLRLAKGREMDFRVSTIPILFGEKVVLRLLDKSALQLDMTKLGFEESSLADLKAAIHKPVGMILVTGPTGSGKTTTLYSVLSELNKETENIVTAEDPVEYNFMGIMYGDEVIVIYAGRAENRFKRIYKVFRSVKVKHLTHNARNPIDLRLDASNICIVRMVLGNSVLYQRERILNPSQGVVNLMSNPGSHLAHASPFLNLCSLTFQFPNPFGAFFHQLLKVLLIFF